MSGALPLSKRRYPAMSPQTMLIVFGAFGCGWALLSVLSGERSRRVREIEAQSAEPEPAPPSVPVASSPASQSKKPPAKAAAAAPAKPK